MFVHAHCLRNEQCACMYNLNKQDGCQMVCMFDQVLDQTISAWIRDKETKRGSSAGGLMVGHWPRMPGVWVQVPLGTTLFVLKINSLSENYLFIINRVS